MKQRLWRTGKIATGVLLLVLGVIGLFLPFLQGILFLIMGLSLLSSESDRAKAWLQYLERRVGWRKVVEPTAQREDR
jgi:uncharacterized membrane protein YbaN (DUF454 family)